MPAPSLAPLLRDRRIVVCVGSGGVGKTTTAATLGLGAARAGRRVLVLTIDPAKRLANALGIDGLRHDPIEVPRERLAAAGLALGKGGALFAMMLDQKRAFDELVERHAKETAVRDRIFANPLYRQISTTLAGSHEYAAMSKLYEIQAEGGYDLIVLDTPPTANALDFLDAPQRLSAAIDSPAIGWLTKPYLDAGRFSLKAVGMGAAFVLGRLARFVGSDFLDEMARFFVEFNQILGGFRERAQKVYEVLRRRDAAFVLISSAEPMSVDEAIYFRDRLDEAKLPLGGFVVNRVHPRRAARVHAVHDEAAERQLGLVEAIAEVDRLVDRHRLRARDEDEGRVAAAEHLVHLLRALAEAAEDLVELDEEARHLVEEVGADEARQPAEHERGAHADGLEREATGVEVGLGQPPDRRRVDGRGEALRGVEEVERVRGRRRVEDDEVVATLRLDLVELRHRRVLVRPRERRADLPVEGVGEDAIADRGLLGVPLDELVERALLIEHHGEERAALPERQPGRREPLARHLDGIVPEPVDAERVRQALGRIDRQHQHPPPGARGAEAEGRRGGGLPHAARAHADDDAAVAQEGSERRRGHGGASFYVFFPADATGVTCCYSDFMLFKKPLRDYLAEYAADHAQVGTRLTHMLGIPMIVASLPMLPFNPAMAGALFVGGWALQFVGHYVFEKNDPKFFSDPANLLIGVLWVLIEWAQVFGVELPVPA